MSESKGLSAFQSHRDGLKADLTTTSAIAHAQIELQVLWVKESHRTRFCSELSPTEFGTGASALEGFRLQAVPKGCGQLGPEAGPENGNIVGHLLWCGVGWQDSVLVGQSPVERGVPGLVFALATCLGREALADPLGINSLSERRG